MKICPAIKQLSTYTSGKPVSELYRELGLENIVKLASNERPIPVAQVVQDAMISQLSELNRYPDNNGFELKKALSNHLSNYLIKIEQNQLVLGNGSSNILELVARACVCDVQDEVIFSEYAFLVYPLLTQALGAKSVVVPSKNYGHNLEAMQSAINENTKLIFIANPNNPTGTFLSDKAIYAFLSQVPSDVIVVLDEAYVEYVSDYQTLHFLNEFSNLIITRTFSKAYGLAGLRVGYGIASVELIDYLNRIRAPFNVNSLALVASIASLMDRQGLSKVVALNTQGLVQLCQGFEALRLKYIPSKANFISVKVGGKVRNAQQVNQELLTLGFIVRPIEIPEFIRISIGTKVENQAILKALKSLNL